MTPTGEVTHDIYYQKYLKYKAKYLELKKQLGGAKCLNNICRISSDGTYSSHVYNYVTCIYCGCTNPY